MNLNTTKMKSRTMNEYRQTKDAEYTNPGAKKPVKQKPKDPIEQVKDKIVLEIQDQFFDVIFQAVNDEMEKYFVFRQSNYFTEAGEEEFNETWFEWYHDHHGS